MKFKEILIQQTTHHQLHIGKVMGLDDNDVLSCQYYYPLKDQKKSEKFDRFWRLVQALNLNVIRYSG